MRARTAKVLAPVLLVLLAACSDSDPERFEPPRIVQSSYIETGDADALAERGQLRLLMVDEPGVGPRPRPGTPLYAQMQAASGFARSAGLEPVVVPVPDFDALVPALRAGRGDLIVHNGPLPDAGAEIARTVALTRTRAVLAKRAADPLSDRSGLAGRTIAVPPKSPFWEMARRLQDARPALTVEPRPELSAERRLKLLADGEIDLTIVNRNSFEAALPHIDRIAAAFPVADEHGVAFGLRPDADRLKLLLDRYIRKRALAQLRPKLRRGDLPVVERDGTLRVAMRNDAAHYFIWRGRLMGFEYELAKRFAEHLGLTLEVVIGEDDRALKRMVRQGRADFAAAFLLRGAGDDSGLEYSRPYYRSVYQVVTHAEDRQVRELADLSGRTLHVRKGSDSWRIARELRERAGLDIAIEALPPQKSVAQILTGVADGRYDVTISQSQIVKHAMAWNDRVRAAVDIGKPVPSRWAFRADNPELLAAADAFLAEIDRSTFYNVLLAKYFDDQEHIRQFRPARPTPSGGQLTPYDELLQEYAAEHGFDWRLLAAQVYQESSFDPAARSWAGAVGLLQVMPRTARQVGIEGDLEHPATNLRAGVRYLEWLRERFEDDLSVEDRVWFTLAAYNAGAGHVRDARALAERLGLDPNRWFGHVEQAMLKLSERQYYRDAAFGYVRGREPVDYVRDIRARYQAYRRWTRDCEPDCPPATGGDEVVVEDAATETDATAEADAP